jgi:hypothetical protein
MKPFTVAVLPVRSRNLRYALKSEYYAAAQYLARWAKRFTSHCKKNSHLSQRRTTMKSATDLPNGDLQHLREMTLRSA